MTASVSKYSYFLHPISLHFLVLFRIAFEKLIVIRTQTFRLEARTPGLHLNIYLIQFLIILRWFDTALPSYFYLGEMEDFYKKQHNRFIERVYV